MTLRILGYFTVARAKWAGRRDLDGPLAASALRRGTFGAAWLGSAQNEVAQILDVLAHSVVGNGVLVSGR